MNLLQTASTKALRNSCPISRDKAMKAFTKGTHEDLFLAAVEEHFGKCNPAHWGELQGCNTADEIYSILREAATVAANEVSPVPQRYSLWINLNKQK
jgi:hypothetical protein